MTTTSPYYVLNPNYNPNDAASNRYITDTQAQTEATNKANGLNDLFAPFTNLASGLFKPYQPTQFYTPLPAQPAAPTTTQAPSASYTGAAPAAAAAPSASSALKPNISAGAGGAYTVQAGDTLSAIAARNNTTVAALVAANGIADPNRIAIGQTLKIVPSGGSVQAAPQGNNAAANAGGNTGNAQQPSVANLTPDELANLATLAGKAGISTDAFLQLVQQNATPSSSTTDAIRTKLGIPNLVDQTFSQPSKTLTQQYTDLYNLSGLNDIKSKIASIDAEVNQKRADLVTATGQLNNNPWISQATRAGRLKNLQELAYADINNSLDARQQYMDLYNSGVSQLETQVNLFNQDQQNAQTLNVNHLNYLLNEAERQTTAKQQDNLTAGLRTVPDFLSGLSTYNANKDAQDIRKIYASADAQAQATAATAARYGTLDGKPQTSVQAKANTYADRMAQANGTITSIGDQFSSAGAFGAFLPNQLQSADRQSYEQAKKNFVNAVLRQESGAAIAQSEFDNAEKQYFPQAGDSAQVIAQKALNRQTAINGMYREANVPPPTSTAADMSSADAAYVQSLGLK